MNEQQICKTSKSDSKMVKKETLGCNVKIPYLQIVEL